MKPSSPSPAPVQFDFSFEEEPALPDRICLYGPPNVGKSTFASRFPSPFFIDPESGSKNIVDAKNRYSRFNPRDDAENWDRTLQFLDWFADADHAYQTLVIDTIDKVMGYGQAWVCKNVGIRDKKTDNVIPVNSLGDVGGGYGRGESAMAEQFRRLLGALEHIGRMRGVTIVMLSHEHAANAGNAGTDDEHKVWSPNLDKKCVEILMREFDYVLHAQPQVIVEKVRGDFGTEKKVTREGDGKRFLYCALQAVRRTKSRMRLPKRMDFSYEAFADALRAAGDPEAVIRDVYEKIETVTDAGKRKAMHVSLRNCGRDINAMCELEGRIDEYLAGQAAEAAR